MAAGPKLILAEFLNDAKKAKHALSYAPGCDFISDDMIDWAYLNDRYNELVYKLEILLAMAPEGSAEEIRRIKYGK